jgi:hypothetical protein
MVDFFLFSNDCYIVALVRFILIIIQFMFVIRLSFFASFIYSIYVTDDTICLSDYCVSIGYPPALMWTSHPLCDLQSMGSYYLGQYRTQYAVAKALKAQLCSR